jgi:hypothetical protein
MRWSAGLWLDSTTRWAGGWSGEGRHALHRRLSKGGADSNGRRRGRARASSRCTQRGLRTVGQMGGAIRPLTAATIGEDGRQWHLNSMRTTRQVSTPRQLGQVMQARKAMVGAEVDNEWGRESERRGRQVGPVKIGEEGWPRVRMGDGLRKGLGPGE